MLRFILAGALGAALLAVLAELPRLSVNTDANGIAPPAEPRPAGLRHSIVWLPELPQYQYARREALKHGLDFRSRLDLSTRRASSDARYFISVIERPEPKLEQFQSWLVHVEDADHRPVAGAVLDVSGGMPQHGHGLPVLPRVEEAARAGDYRIDGLQFSMPGWWEIKLYVSKDKVEDTATFNVFLD